MPFDDELDALLGLPTEPKPEKPYEFKYMKPPEPPKASDHLFVAYGVDPDLNLPTYAIFPKDYFQKTGYSWDQHITDDIQAFLPPGFSEEMECSFSFDGGSDQLGIATLTAAGFVQIQKPANWP